MIDFLIRIIKNITTPSYVVHYTYSNSIIAEEYEHYHWWRFDTITYTNEWPNLPVKEVRM